MGKKGVWLAFNHLLITPGWIFIVYGPLKVVKLLIACKLS